MKLKDNKTRNNYSQDPTQIRLSSICRRLTQCVSPNSFCQEFNDYTTMHQLITVTDPNYNPRGSENRTWAPGQLGFERFFRSKVGDFQKKKSSPKFERIFRSKVGDLQKKKKGLHRDSNGFRNFNTC